MASTLVSETVSPASLSAVSASKGLSTIIRRMPKLVVSAMDRARISMPAPARTAVISASRPDLFSTKTESCLINISHNLSHAVYRLVSGIPYGYSISSNAGICKPLTAPGCRSPAWPCLRNGAVRPAPPDEPWRVRSACFAARLRCGAPPIPDPAPCPRRGRRSSPPELP